MKRLALVPSILLLSFLSNVQAQTYEITARSIHVNRDKAAVQKLYREMYVPARDTQQEWTHSGECDPGKLSDATLKARLQEINYFRKMAGVETVTLNPEHNKSAQAAAFLMHRNGALSHHPPTNWKCYSQEGAAGAGSSNLGIGATGIQLFITDNGDNNTSCGHRMWLLHSGITSFGYGGTHNTEAVYVFGPKTRHSHLPSYVAWPPAGFVPAEIIGDRWTFSLPRDNADYSKATVQLSLNGQSIPLNYTEATEYGEEGLAFELENFHTLKPKLMDQNVKVQVNHVVVGNEIREYMYEVVLFQAGEVPIYATTDTELRISFDEIPETETEEVAFADRKLELHSDLVQQSELSQLTVDELKAKSVKDLVYNSAFSSFAMKVANLRKEKNPDQERLMAWATEKIKLHLARQAGLTETQTAAALAPKFLLVEVKKMIPLGGQVSYGEIAASLVEKFAEHPGLMAFVQKYKSVRQTGIGLSVKRIDRNGQSYAGVYATLVIAPAKLKVPV